MGEPAREGGGTNGTNALENVGDGATRGISRSVRKAA